MIAIMRCVIRFGLPISLTVILAVPSGAGNQVDIGITCGAQHDTIWEGYHATLDFYIENDVILGGMSLGYEIWSPDDASWNWLSQPDGFGFSQYVTLVPGARLTPTCFDMTGFLVTEENIDGFGHDTIMCGGVTMVQGLTIGPLQHMYSYHIEVITGTDDVKTICVDSCFVPPYGLFYFVDLFGLGSYPVTLWPYGGKCWPVATLHEGDANGDNDLNLSDAVYLIQYVFSGGPPPPNRIEGDANGDCDINLSDAVHIINYIFKEGDPPICDDICEWP